MGREKGETSVFPSIRGINLRHSQSATRHSQFATRHFLNGGVYGRFNGKPNG